MDLRDAFRSVGGHLFANRQVHSHVEEGVCLAAFRRELGGERRVAGVEPLHVLRMFCDHRGQLRLQRFQRLLRAELAPRLEVHTAKLISGLSGKNGHVR